MDIMPKINSDMMGLHVLKKYIEKFKKIEIELKEEDYGFFTFKDEIETIMNVLPNTKEITIKPFPNQNFLEVFFYMKDEKIKEIFETLKKISEDYQIHINIIFPVTRNFDIYKKLFLFEMKQMLDIIQGYDIFILIENVVFIDEDKCSVFEICKFFGNKQLKVSLNWSNIKIKNNFYNYRLEDYVEKYIGDFDCNKYVYQVCFTECHTKEKLNEELELLKKYNLIDKIIVTDINDNTFNNKKEVEEIELLLEKSN